jgi:hypothetical protein
MSQTAETSNSDRYTPKPPRQVVADMAAADEIRKQMAQNGQEPVNGPQEPVQQQQPSEGPGTPPTPETPPGAPPAAPQGQILGEGETWEQRARSAQGRYESQVSVNKQLNDRLAQLEQTLNIMQATGAPQVEPTPPATPQKLSLVTDQERTDFGEDFLNVVAKRAREEYFPEFDQLAKRLKQIESRVDGTVEVVARTQKQELYATLDSQVSNWREVNKSPQFKDWLTHLDPLSGRKRHDMLQEAYSRQEAGRVVSFFRGFLTEAAGTPTSQPNPPPTASSPPNGATATTGGALTLEQLAAPGRARSGQQGNLPPDKPVYTRAWIERFMADKRTGKYRGREADADAIERDIYQAQHEGRIQ